MTDSTGAHESASLPNRERAEVPDKESSRKQVAEGAPQPSVAVAPTTCVSAADAHDATNKLDEQEESRAAVVQHVLDAVRGGPEGSPDRHRADVRRAFGKYCDKIHSTGDGRGDGTPAIDCVPEHLRDEVLTLARDSLAGKVKPRNSLPREIEVDGLTWSDGVTRAGYYTADVPLASGATAHVSVTVLAPGDVWQFTSDIMSGWSVQDFKDHAECMRAATLWTAANYNAWGEWLSAGALGLAAYRPAKTLMQFIGDYRAEVHHANPDSYLAVTGTEEHGMETQECVSEDIAKAWCEEKLAGLVTGGFEAETGAGPDWEAALRKGWVPFLDVFPDAKHMYGAPATATVMHDRLLVLVFDSDLCRSEESRVLYSIDLEEFAQIGCYDGYHPEDTHWLFADPDPERVVERAKQWAHQHIRDLVSQAASDSMKGGAL